MFVKFMNEYPILLESYETRLMLFDREFFSDYNHIFYIS